jgi:APA family basic amino acid/polyamine antiporter
VAVAFSRYLGVLVPAVSPTAWIIAPINLSSGYAISLSTQQVIAILLIVLLTFINTRGLKIGKLIQNVFTSAKTLSLVALILIGLGFALRNSETLRANFSPFWPPREVSPIKPDLSFISTVSATAGAFGLFIAFCAAQVGSLFSADAWNNITFTAGEVKNPRRNIPLSLAAGTALVTILYLLANVAYLCLLPLNGIQHAPDDRVATAAIEVVFSGAGPIIMAVAIMVSTFGCNNGLILAGARVYYAMARDGLFFKATGRLNAQGVPAAGLVLQCVWTCLLVLPRTRQGINSATGQEQYGNLYGNLLDYVIFSVLIFYVLTIIGLFILRRKRPEVERPYRALGYPIIPALYIGAASAIALVLILYKTQTSWPGLMIVLAGVPVYFVWKWAQRTRRGFTR